MVDVVVEAVAVAIVLVAALAFMLWRLRKMRATAAQMREDLKLGRPLLSARGNGPSTSVEEAHNTLRLAQVELATVEASGTDVERPRSLLAEAQSRLQRRDPTHALRLAREAHELLIALNRSPPARPSLTPLATSSPVREVPPPDPLVRSTPRPFAGESSNGPVPKPEPESALPPAPSARAQKNEFESRFQIRLLQDEITGAANRPGAAIGEASTLRDSAQSSFDRKEFTEALRLALRGRRILGGRVETVPLGPVPTAGVSSPSPTPSPDGSPGTCPQCGRPVGPADQFCRGCGRSVGPSACARCGAPLAQDDAFCGRCGAPAPK